MNRLSIAASVVGAVAVAALVWAPRLVAAQDARLRLADPQIHVMTSGGSSIGVTVREVTAEDVQKAKLDGAGGVFIETVREATPASRAGLRSGDIVLEFDGERVRSVQQFQRLVSESAAGRVVRAVVSRDGGRQTLEVTPERRDALGLLSRNVERLPRNFSFNFDDLAPQIRTLVNPRQLGATLTPLGEQLETYFGVSNGVLVSNVAADTPASAAGLRAGDVITQINGRRVEAPGDVAQAVRNADAGAQLDIVVMRDRKEVKLTAKLPEREPRSGRRGVAL